MQLIRKFGTVAVSTALAAGFVFGSPVPALSVDLQDTVTAVNHPAVDVSDLYVFPSPADPANVVLVMNTNPVIPSGQGTSRGFDASVLYQFQIAHGAAGAADTVIQFAAASSSGNQTLKMYGPSAPNANSPSVATVVASSASTTIPYNSPTTLTVADAAGVTSSVKVFAGPRAEPDFFDLTRFYSLFPDRDYRNHSSMSVVPSPSPDPITFRGFPSSNANQCDTSAPVEFFAAGKYNVLAIVVEMPKAMLAKLPDGTSNTRVNIWATTSTVSGV